MALLDRSDLRENRCDESFKGEGLAFSQSVTICTLKRYWKVDIRAAEYIRSQTLKRGVRASADWMPGSEIGAL